MPVNLEIKARLNNPKSALLIAEKLDVESEDVLYQRDTYFECQAGRLKLREMSGIDSEMIYYDRDETEEVRRSDYMIYKFPPGKSLEAILKKGLAIINVVAKNRHLFIYQGARIHIDDVEKLGWFIEFEVPLLTNKSRVDKLMQELFEKFSIQKVDIIRESYLDLLRKREENEKKSPIGRN
jgi:predicted adenylyl cyclase CyaB